MEHRTEHNTLNNIHALIALIKTPVKSVPADKQVIAFHFNTKFAHLLGDWTCVFARLQTSPKLKEATAAYGAWRGLATDFVACLPDVEVPDGESGEPIDPFTYLRQAFPSNRKSPASKIPEVTAQMWGIAKSFCHDGGSGFSQDHRNLVELAAMCGFVSLETEKAFCKEAFGMEKTTGEVIDEYLEELEGGAMLGSLKKKQTANMTIFEPGHRSWAIRGDTLLVEGNGCISEFSLVRHENQVCVIDFAEKPQTSVTNLAEIVHAAVTATFGENTEVYEAYPHDLQNSPGSLSKITVEDGHAGWTATSDNIGGLLAEIQKQKPAPCKTIKNPSSPANPPTL